MNNELHNKDIQSLNKDFARLEKKVDGIDIKIDIFLQHYMPREEIMS